MEEPQKKLDGDIRTDVLTSKTITIFGELNEYTAERVIQQILSQIEDSQCNTISILIYSSGGSYLASQAIIDVMKLVNKRGIKFTAIATGTCAGNASLIWLAANTRMITRNARMVLNAIQCRLDPKDEQENIRRIREKDFAQKRMSRRLSIITGSHNLGERVEAEDTIILTPFEASQLGLSSILY